MRPGEAFDRRIQAVLTLESERPERCWWLAFAGKEGARGVVIIRAPGAVTAAARAHELGINPGGQVESFPFPEEPPAGMSDRLLGEAELVKAGLV